MSQNKQEFYAWLDEQLKPVQDYSAMNGTSWMHLVEIMTGRCGSQRVLPRHRAAALRSAIQAAKYFYKTPRSELLRIYRVRNKRSAENQKKLMAFQKSNPGVAVSFIKGRAPKGCFDKVKYLTASTPWMESGLVDGKLVKGKRQGWFVKLAGVRDDVSIWDLDVTENLDWTGRI